MPSSTSFSCLLNLSWWMSKLSLMARACVFTSWWATGLGWSGRMVKEVELCWRSMFLLLSTLAILGLSFTASSPTFSLSPTHGRLVFWLISATEIGAGGSLDECFLSLWMTMSLWVCTFSLEWAPFLCFVISMSASTPTLVTSWWTSSYFGAVELFVAALLAV